MTAPSPPLPPGLRSRAALVVTAAAARGRLELQACADCGAVQYPPREACRACLSGALHPRPQDGAGELIAETTLHHSNDEYFRERLPWRLGLVRLDAGPTAMVHVHGGCGPAPSRVRVGARLDKSGQGVLVAFPPQEDPNMVDDRQLREMTCDPRGRKVLVTDGQTAVGQALVHALVDAGADTVWVGHSQSSSLGLGLDSIAAVPRVVLVPLDVTDSTSVRALAAELGSRVDILINDADASGPGIAPGSDVENARGEMDVNYFGLLRLVQEFGPALRARGAGRSGAAAWVNLLSVYALSNFPPHCTYSASKAAALSLSQCLRAEMQPAGIRVINVFPGPLDEDSKRSLPPPLTPLALARAVADALCDGIEDVYPGEVAQEWLARWRENPKVLERELADLTRAAPPRGT